MYFWREAIFIRNQKCICIANLAVKSQTLHTFWPQLKYICIYKRCMISNMCLLLPTHSKKLICRQILLILSFQKNKKQCFSRSKFCFMLPLPKLLLMLFTYLIFLLNIVLLLKISIVAGGPASKNIYQQQFIVWFM